MLPGLGTDDGGRANTDAPELLQFDGARRAIFALRGFAGRGVSEKITPRRLAAQSLPEMDKRRSSSHNQTQS